MPRGHQGTTRGTRKEGEGWDTGGETESGKKRKLKVTGTQGGLAPQTLSPPARTPHAPPRGTCHRPRSGSTRAARRPFPVHAGAALRPRLHLRQRRGGAAQRRGGSSCASERPTRAFPVAPLASRPCKDRALPPTALYFRFLLAGDGGLPATESQPEPPRASLGRHLTSDEAPPASLLFAVQCG